MHSPHRQYTPHIHTQKFLEQALEQPVHIPPNTDQWLNTRESSKILGLPVFQVRQLIRDGVMGEVRRNERGHFKVRQDAVVAYRSLATTLKPPWRTLVSESELFWLYDHDTPPITS